MRHARIHTASLATSFAVCAAVALGGEPSSLEVLIVVQSDGTHCAVEKKELLCSDVVSHLRNVLKLPPRSRVHLQVGPAAKYESVMRVADLLNKSEYPLPVGYLAPEYKD